MRFLSLATAALLAPAALGAVIEPAVRPRNRGFGCGTHEPTPEELAATQEIAAMEVAQGGALEARQTVNVEVYFHILASGTSVADGYLTVHAPSSPLFPPFR